MAYPHLSPLPSSRHRRMRRLLAAAVAAASMGAFAIAQPGVARAEATAPTATDTLPAIDGVTRVDAHTLVFSAGAARVRVTGTTAATLHVEVAPTGAFSDPDAAPADPSQPSAKMIPEPPAPAADLTLADEGDAYRISTPDAVLTITKASPEMTLARPDGTVLFREAAPLSWNGTSTTQTLDKQPGEQFYGAGEQNGGYNHTGTTVHVANSFNWNEGGYNNSQPYYVSSAGYGVFRHTFAPGSYTFGSTTDPSAPVTTTENEQRFDAYYFVGDLRQVIGDYTSLVGKPFMPPIYGLELGDSDCYLHNANRGERHTLDSLKIAQGYVDNGMPNGWMLVNDGYGCGYENLPQTAAGLQADNMQLGLWTQSALSNQQQEVQAGVRVRKLDVAWVGPGYRFALDGCQTAYQGIEKYSDARGFVYQPNSWAGAQRCSVLWSGDQYGSWDYIRWQIPTYAASTMSGIAYNTGDVDGIFGGSTKTYVRDLQWKSFLPTTMTMDGWAGSDKQPWRYGTEANAINRKYLLLKERLLPYSYTYSAQAHRTGVGQVRPLYLQYPNDPIAASDAAKEEFMSGDDFLVAPVYEDSSVRNGIYLPAGTWTDYWTGRTFQGPTTINGYYAPLDRLPLFVRGGSVIPMWPDGTQSWKTRDTTRLSVDVYPQGEGSFDLYEDDGVTRQADAGRSSTQRLSVSAPQQGRGDVRVSIGAVDGSYDGQVAARAYDLTVHTPVQPAKVFAGNHALDQVAGADALAGVSTGWYYDAEHGVAHVKTADVATRSSLVVSLKAASAIVGVQDDSSASVAFTAPTITAPGSTTSIPVTVRNTTSATLTGVTVSISADRAGLAAPSSVPVADSLAPGATATVDVDVAAAPDLASGKAVLTATAGYTARARSYTSSYSQETTIPYPSVAAAANGQGISTAATYATGNLDGSKDSLYGEGLASAGLTPGASVSARGASFTWPAVPAGGKDNVAAAGQTIAVRGRGNVLGLLGTGTSSAAGGAVTVTYADGTTSTATTGFPNWCCLATDTYGASIVKAVKGRYTPNGYANATVDYRVYANTIRLDPTRDVVAVTLPSNSAMHVFDLAVGSVALPPVPPAGTSWVSDLPWISATNGYGPVERDLSNGENGAGDGHPLTLDGTVYPKGLGVHAPSTVSYYLGGKCTRFTATVGVDDEIPDYGSVIFTVLVDGKPKQVSPTMDGLTKAVSLDVDVTGASYLDLQASAGASSISGDHGDWAGSAADLRLTGRRRSCQRGRRGAADEAAETAAAPDDSVVGGRSCPGSDAGSVPIRRSARRPPRAAACGRPRCCAASRSRSRAPCRAARRSGTPGDSSRRTGPRGACRPARCSDRARHARVAGHARSRTGRGPCRAAPCTARAAASGRASAATSSGP